MPKKETALVPQQRIERCIYLFRGQKVMLDADLADLYEVETGALVRAVKRNRERFPSDLMFRLTKKEFDNLRCQIGISRSWGGRRHPPHAFTEQGVAMLSSVLRSKRAIQVNLQIMRTFVHLRAYLNSHEELRAKLAQLEGKYDHQFKIVFEAIQQMLAPPKKPPKIGFTQT